MTKQTGRNALATVGAWWVSRALAMFISLVLTPLSNRLVFQGDSGTVFMWVWFGLPEAIASVVATISILWLIETKKPYRWVGALAVLHLYTGVMEAMGLLDGFQSTPQTADYVGIAVKGLLSFAGCVVAAVWYHRRGIDSDGARAA
jgi:hypothetical protein